MTSSPSRLTFVTCLLAAPVLFGLAVWPLGLGGTYASRFAQVGYLGLAISLPIWFTVFAWLAWRAAKRSAQGIRPYVMAALGANVAALVLYPALIGITVMTGTYQRWIASVPDPTEAPPEPLQAALFAAGAAFVLGLFFLPILAALFGWAAGKLGLVKQS